MNKISRIKEGEATLETRLGCWTNWLDASTSGSGISICRASIAYETGIAFFAGGASFSDL